MYKFVVNEKSRGVLLPLAILIGRLPLQGVTRWQFLYVNLWGNGFPFGMTFDQFEAATRAMPAGFEVCNADFQEFLKSDFQIIDGVIEGWSNQVPPKCIIHLDCDDASQWELTTDEIDLATNLERAGFTRS